MSAKVESICINPEERVFYLRRLHSLTGIIPIGGFLLFHFFENLSVKHGAEAFNHTVSEISKMPYLYVVEALLLLLPIIFHSVYGLFISSSSKPNLVRESYLRNWLYFFQRLSGFIAFAYIFYHIWTTRVWALFVKGDNITYSDMHAMLSNNSIFLFYLIGIAAVTFHFANGIWGFCITWGLVKTRQGQLRLTVLTLLLFLILCIVGFDIASAFRYQQSFLARFGI